MHQDIVLQLRQKQRQRYIEYIILMMIQIVFAVRLSGSGESLMPFIISLSSCAVGWSLSFIREQRRTLGVHNTKRLMGDILESFVLTAMIVIIGIMAQILSLSLVVVWSVVASIFFAFFLGSCIGEWMWRRRFFSRLTQESQYNYVANLNRSLLFPYNLVYLRQIFGKSR